MPDFTVPMLGEPTVRSPLDPSYIVRAAPAHAGDAIFCGQLAEEAVHAPMAGKTGLVVGLWLNRFTYLPLSAVTAGRKVISPDGAFGGRWSTPPASRRSSGTSPNIDIRSRSRSGSSYPARGLASG